MKTELIPIGEVKPNPNNPRVIKGDVFAKLVKSIQEFPEMLEIRPIVIDKDNIVLGGNMRLKACIEAGLDLIPCIRASNLSEEKQKEFMIKDNVSSGIWDFDVLANNWNLEDITKWGLEVVGMEDIKDDKDFEDRMSRLNDENCLYPITPKFDEKHELFIIVSENEIDANWLRERLGMQKMLSYKSGKLQKSNIISIKDIQNAL